MITCKKKSYINTYLIINFKTDFLYLKYIISIKDKSYEVIYIYINYFTMAHNFFLGMKISGSIFQHFLKTFSVNFVYMISNHCLTFNI